MISHDTFQFVTKNICQHQNGVNLKNLSYLKPNNEILHLDAQSVYNKTAVPQDYLCDVKIDLCAVTESWVTENQTAVKVESLFICCSFHIYYPFTVYFRDYFPIVCLSVVVSVFLPTSLMFVFVQFSFLAVSLPFV